MHCNDKTCIAQVFEGLHKVFARRMYGLRAVRSLKQVVVTGGQDGGYNSRDEVSVEFINKARPLYVQVLQYDETAATWSGIGRMQKARYYHAVVASGIVGQTHMGQFVQGGKN